MSVECFCSHYESEHDRAEHGQPRRCRVRYPRRYLGHGAVEFELCDCPGFEPNHDDQEDNE
ncbi:MAG: hypothetical protein J2P17_16570 [Mycobacterium sp.]|nr:hypothetical protein [Mycobacterium sp.]